MNDNSNPNTALRDKLAKLEVPKMVIWVDGEMKVETTNLTDKTIDEILKIIQDNQKEAYKKGYIDGGLSYIKPNQEPEKERELRSELRDFHQTDEYGNDVYFSLPIWVTDQIIAKLEEEKTL